MDRRSFIKGLTALAGIPAFLVGLVKADKPVDTELAQIKDEFYDGKDVIERRTGTQHIGLIITKCDCNDLHLLPICRGKGNDCHFLVVCPHHPPPYYIDSNGKEVTEYVGREF